MKNRQGCFEETEMAAAREKRPAPVCKAQRGEAFDFWYVPLRGLASGKAVLQTSGSQPFSGRAESCSRAI